MKNQKQNFIYSLMLVCSMNVTLLFVFHNFEFEKVVKPSLGWMLLTDISVLGFVFIVKCIKRKEHPIKAIERKESNLEMVQGKERVIEQVKEQAKTKETKQSKSAILAAIASDASLLVRMKMQSEKLYQHSSVIAELSKRAAHFIGADAGLACAGGWYHEIGRLSGTDYVLHGVKLIKEHHLPLEIADIIIQHKYKEQLPQTLEAAIVMLTDNIVTTIQYVKLKGDHQITPEKVIENTFLVRMNQGILDEANMSLAEFTKLKQFYLNMVGELG